ncbi:MAG: 50S ribosomal protein L24 [Candidatus Portnoybacteria bacterium RIFCSPLOWO2_12_FULL_39_9]|uniref:Large ribosomal subunit protein uL24 n=1 Tax=Candidatus Portnoybacteria bacterium RIFCSPHIGHO2_12_FULL_38_9 TaxID=1801997 RepID=A0A1G2FGV5_9BACT|nr:MAG: 50S ribosomal protein L24 [Candidatus Portnoybacteria bacterium RBG_13_40_8]OGZ36121.1 MAG: 50S ribosomal protein L24 [Candidatus Portnoybacteria bacterium RIFCSPHIGHO2_02_FULL_39_12]OGZ37276.1 MAG: 50S ribosomal protein L24 [Candidatus Portnoybacteria bacterium RIFCSPHIGHO2_12_FULL_38_9]OGZ38992.1 MAG: 50S ribosomal protein L24 [Candidatus Portnoybacteria bacterium RIFCSPLOWO2_01_FULL_38_39]OGZ40659.1 MAG: 50S ribosomal protein L24 [Candidatus Portnoybacteria bacterium RIFCSPLOWO2_12_F
MKIRKNDIVLIITGKDRGKKAKVLESFPKERKIAVEGVNIAKKHRRPRREGEKGQIIEIPKPIDISNVKLVCPKCNQATRVGYRLTENNKYRICKKCGQEI